MKGPLMDEVRLQQMGVVICEKGSAGQAAAEAAQ